MFQKLKKRIKRFIWKLKRRIKMRMYKKWVIPHKKTKDNLILFESVLGRSYTGNPRAIYEEMVRRGLDQKYEIYWTFKVPEKFELPGQAKTCVRGSYQYYKIAWQAKLWVFDTRPLRVLVKNPNTKFMMTWHGTPLKKLALDMDDVQIAGSKGIEHYKSRFWQDVRQWDYLIAQNDYSAKKFRWCFDFKKNMLKTGYPRNDVLVNNNNPAYIDALKEKYKIPKNKKVLLYAPTWRDNVAAKGEKYLFKPHVNFDTLYRKLRKEYVMIVKYHYLIANKINWTRFKGFIYNIDTDINDLYLMSDMMITDYSSTMFDYSILNRPMVFYTYDYEEYFDVRGFYFDMAEVVPGPFARETDELIAILKEHDFSQYDEKYRKFREKFNHLDDGQASGRVVDVIEEYLEQKPLESTAEAEEERGGKA